MSKHVQCFSERKETFISQCKCFSQLPGLSRNPVSLRTNCVMLRESSRRREDEFYPPASFSSRYNAKCLWNLSGDVAQRRFSRKERKFSMDCRARGRWRLREPKCSKKTRNEQGGSEEGSRGGNEIRIIEIDFEGDEKAGITNENWQSFLRRG